MNTARVTEQNEKHAGQSFRKLLVKAMGAALIWGSLSSPATRIR